MTNPTGCADCNADTTITKDPDHPNITRITIAHDDTCAFYTARLNRAQRRAATRKDNR